jgi:hypothetical protein
MTEIEKAIVEADAAIEAADEHDEVSDISIAALRVLVARVKRAEERERLSLAPCIGQLRIPLSVDACDCLECRRG